MFTQMNRLSGAQCAGVLFHRGLFHTLVLLLVLFCFVLFCFVAVKVRDYRVGAGEKVAYSVGEFA